MASTEHDNGEAAPHTPSVLVHVEFSGGLETLFNGQKHFKLSLPFWLASHGASASPGAETAARQPTVATLLRAIYSEILPASANRALFLAESTLSAVAQAGSTAADEQQPTDVPKGIEGDGVLWDVRPGILVLVNEVDWELDGGVDAELHDGDEVLFVSTLHGG